MTLHIAQIATEARHRAMLAGAEAYRVFCRPDLSHHRSPEQETLVGRARVHLGKARWFTVQAPSGQVQCYEYEPIGAPSGQTVALVHGWTSEASFMAAFVEPLRQRGNRVVAFDFPAHGLSAGIGASLVDCARATLAVFEAVGRIDVVVAHSLGCQVALLVGEGGPPMRRAFKAGRYVLIAGPNRLSWITSDFGRHLGLSAVAQRAYERHIERAGRRSVAQFSAANLLTDVARQALVVHCRDDEQVPFAHAEEIASEVGSVRLHAVQGLGHRKVLFAPPVVRVVRDYISR
jgi:pimeloyl-ACP methyl ester carboxylesterase